MSRDFKRMIAQLKYDIDFLEYKLQVAADSPVATMWVARLGELKRVLRDLQKGFKRNSSNLSV